MQNCLVVVLACSAPMNVNIPITQCVCAGSVIQVMDGAWKKEKRLEFFKFSKTKWWRVTGI